MPTTRADRPVARLLTAAALLLVSGCDLLGEDATPPGAPSGQAAEQLAGQMQRVLRDRARALLEGDQADFLATVGQGSGRFVARERTYFANLVQLPLSRLSYRVDAGSITGGAGRYEAVVDVRLELAGYDEAPVVRPARFTFTERAAGAGLVVVADRDLAWERRHDVDTQPWDTGSIQVREGAGVLGVFDDRSVAEAPEIIAAVEAGIDRVSSIVPYEWAGRVVVYALSDTEMLDGLGGLPVEDPDGLDAVAFPVTARADDDRVASTRFLLHPRMLSSDPDQLARLIRHEITHIAVGARDDEVWRWLGEGIAEWVSVQPMSPTNRLISRAAINAATAGPDGLPPDADFNGPEQAAHYGLSWWACQAIVDLYGEPMLWRLLDDLAETSPTDRDDVLQKVLHLGTGQLAREAARRILATYS